LRWVAACLVWGCAYWRKLTKTLSRAASPWSRLGLLGSNSWIRSSYLWFLFLPIAARVIGGVNEAVMNSQYAEIGADWCIGLPFRWEVLFYAATSFAIASVLYEIFCPRIVRHFRGVPDITSLGLSVTQLANHLHDVLQRRPESRGDTIEMAREVVLVLEPSSVGAIDALAVREEGRKESFESELRLALTRIRGDSQGIPEAFWMIRELGEGTSPVARWLCMVLYTVGLVLLVLLAVQNLVAVIIASHPSMSQTWLNMLTLPAGCSR
jgi:hypothetical protein